MRVITEGTILLQRFVGKNKSLEHVLGGLHRHIVRAASPGKATTRCGLPSRIIDLFRIGPAARRDPVSMRSR